MFWAFKLSFDVDILALETFWATLKKIGQICLKSSDHPVDRTNREGGGKILRKKSQQLFGRVKMFSCLGSLYVTISRLFPSICAFRWDGNHKCVGEGLSCSSSFIKTSWPARSPTSSKDRCTSLTNESKIRYKLNQDSPSTVTLPPDY